MTAIGSHRHDYGSTRASPDCWHRLASVDATRPCGPRPATEPRGRAPVPATPFTTGLPSSSRSSPVGLPGVVLAPVDSADEVDRLPRHAVDVPVSRRHCTTDTHTCVAVVQAGAHLYGSRHTGAAGSGRPARGGLDAFAGSP